MAAALSVVMGRRLGRPPGQIWPFALPLIRAAANHGVPVRFLAALVEHESNWTNEADGSGALGYTQQIPRYAGDWWPYALPPEGRHRRRAMLSDLSAQADAMASQLVSLARRGARTRHQQGETTYYDHAMAHADTWRSKGGDPTRQPDVPVRYFRNPWLAMYNRGGSGGKWPRLDSPRRPDGSLYQTLIEAAAEQIGAELRPPNLARRQRNRADFDPRVWSW